MASSGLGQMWVVVVVDVVRVVGVVNGHENNNSSMFVGGIFCTLTN